MSAPNRSDRPTDQPGRAAARFAVAGLLAAAGGLHLAALPGHLQASTAAGAFFAVTAAAQLLGAVLVSTRGSSRTMVAVVAGNLAVLGLWALSRTTGLPTGGELGLREPLGVLDGLAAAGEVLVVGGGLAMLRRRSPATRPQRTTGPQSAARPRSATGRRPAAWVPTFALGITWLASGGAGLALADTGHHHAGGHAHIVPIGAAAVEAPPVASPSDVAPFGGLSHDDLGPARHNHEGPQQSGVSLSGTCPRGHDCTDHPH